MSCGNPHEIPCSEVLLRIHEYLDNEAEALDGLTFHQMQHHLEECAPCMAQFGLEQMIRTLVQRACGCHGTGCTCGCAPSSELRARIVLQITTMRDVSSFETRIERPHGPGPVTPF